MRDRTPSPHQDGWIPPVTIRFSAPKRYRLDRSLMTAERLGGNPAPIQSRSLALPNSGCGSNWTQPHSEARILAVAGWVKRWYILKAPVPACIYVRIWFEAVDTIRELTVVKWRF